MFSQDQQKPNATDSEESIRAQLKESTSMPGKDCLNKSQIVRLILKQDTEEALSELAEYYRVNVPKLRIGLPKGHRRNLLGCYSTKDQTISLLKSDVIGNPFVILHEFYHHMRTSVDKTHRGTERNADKFATEFIEEYKATLTHYSRTTCKDSGSPL